MIIRTMTAVFMLVVARHCNAIIMHVQTFTETCYNFMEYKKVLSVSYNRICIFRRTHTLAITLDKSDLHT